MSSLNPPMDPTRPESFTHKWTLLATGRRYHFVDEVPHGYDPQRDLTILCIHGFPDLWAGWKYQIGPWVRAGYRVVAPDMLGYGESDKPDGPEEYSLKTISNDLASILDAILVRKAIVIGHDWGSHIASRFALWYPERILGVAHVSLGYFPPSSNFEKLEEFVKKFPIYKYQLYFASKGCVAELEKNIVNFFRYAFHTNVFSGPDGIPENFGDVITGRTRPNTKSGRFLLDRKELQYMTSQNDTLRGPTNYYRTGSIRFDEEKGGRLPETYEPGTPVLFLRGNKDGTSSKAAMRETLRLYPTARIITYEDAAHWLMLEKKETLTRDVLDWLSEVGL